MNKDNYMILYSALIGVVVICTCGYVIDSQMKLEYDVKILRSQAGMMERIMFNSSLESAGGRYFINSSNIAVYGKGNNPKTLKKIANHEIGHYIWYEFLSDKDKKEYKKIYKFTNEFISDYAKTKVEEDFAENIGESVICKINYEIIPEDRRNFIKNKVEPILEK